MVAVLARPDHFHKKDVALSGYLYAQAGHWGLYLNRESAKQCAINGIRLNLSEEEKARYTEYLDRYCLVEGVYDMFGGGYAWSGSLVQIRCIVPIDEYVVINLRDGRSYRVKAAPLD
jgi:hypothetical protein